MKFEYFITANNITYKEGDTLLVDFTNNFENFKSIDTLQFDFNPIEAWDTGHNIYIRWSYDITGSNIIIENFQTTWSSWIQISRDGLLVSDINTILAKVFRKDPDSFKLQFKLVRRGLAQGPRSIEKITIDYTLGTLPESPELTLFTLDKTSCKAVCTPAQSFGSGILINTKEGLFRPYDLMKPAQNLYAQMACAAAEMFGHCVRYFKTTPKQESSDKILKEYSLFNVTDVKDIKILIPNNALPDNMIQYMPYDMDFSDGIECHIIKSHFERAFGQYRVPEEKDYIYFPLTDRIYEVHSAYMFKDFMGMEAYYKVRLYKWQDKQNVMRENPELDLYVDSLHQSFEEILQPDIEKEFKVITKPQQYTTIAVGGHDHIRSHINNNLSIIEKDLSNYYTIVSKNYYDLRSNMNPGDIAIKYKLNVDRSATDNTAFTCWFNPKRRVTDSNSFDILLDGYNLDEQRGILIKLNYTGLVTSSLEVKINESVYLFENLPDLADAWYGLCLNIQSEFKQVSLFLWEMQFNINNPGLNRTTNLLKLYDNTLDYITEEIKPTDTVYKLRGGSTNLTNIRIWSELIEEEKQSTILNQYVVKDQQYALLIDNSLAPLRLDKSFIR